MTGGAALLEHLNPTQKQAVLHRDGPLVVFAGAGSGKTRIIAARIAYLVEGGINPNQILAVTFTNKAAGEMRSRVKRHSEYAGKALIATFHSACARWLREFADELGFSSNFSIYDDSDSQSALKLVLKELKVKTDGDFSVQDYRHAIHQAKTYAMLPSDEQLPDADFVPPAGVQVYARYQEYLAQCNAMDFGDLIMNMLLLLRRNERVRQILRNRFEYIMVDEYQDTNRGQFELISWIVGDKKNLFVVGDDDQSIYSWRGAVPANIINFESAYPGAKRVLLDQNYRCSGTIVNAAAAMVAHNKKRVAKTLRTDNPAGELIDYRLEADGELEAQWVVEQIESENFEYEHIAVFYRTNAQSRSLEDALRRANIPYRIFGTVRFYDRQEVKDLLAYFRLIVNPRDDQSFMRVVNVPTRGIGDKAVDSLIAFAEAQKMSLSEAALELRASGNALAKKFAPFNQLISELRSMAANCLVEDFLDVVLERTGYFEYLKKKFPDLHLDKWENVQELGAAIADYRESNPNADLAPWLQAITLSSSEEESDRGVTLMTLHMAKGLEFERVYIVGLEDGLLPHRQSMETPDAIEEERRLLYVGMTRAKTKLSLASAHRRRLYSQWVANQPSRFLKEIPLKYFAKSIDRSAAEPAASYSYEFDQARTAHIAVGEMVAHPTFGHGVIEEIDEEFGSRKVIVNFEEFGRRKVSANHLESPQSP